MSQLLELLGRGLQDDLGDLLDRYFWTPPVRTTQQLEDACRAPGDHPDLHLQLGLAYLRGQQIPEAAGHLKLACRQKPDFFAARVALAAACHEQGDHAGAIENLQIANGVHGDQAPVLFAIGFSLEKLRKPAEAMEYYRDAIKQDPAFVPARQRLAAVDLTLEDLDEAIEQYEAMRIELPQFPWVRTTLAHLYFRAGQFSRAVEEFECAIAMEPENWSLVDEEVEALVADGQVREAIERLHELLQNQGDFADLHVRLGDLYSQSGNDAAALKHFHAALEIQPNYLEAEVKLGTHHLVAGRWEQAAETFAEAAELNEDLLASYIGMGVAQEAGGKHDQALASFDLAAAIEPNSTLLLAEMARLQLKAAAAEEMQGDLSAPEPASGEAQIDNDDLLRKQLQRHAEQVEINPTHADLRYRYGVLLRAEGRNGEAMEQFARAVEINPTYVQAIVKLGISQQELGLIAEAVETFKKALELKAHYVDVHYRLALLYTDRRELAEAVKHMEAAVEGAPDNGQIRASLALSLQNMGLADRTAATWRSLWKLHHVQK